MRRVVFALVVLSLLSVCSYASVYPPNYGFEMGDTSYWTENPDNGSIGVVTSWTHLDSGGSADFTWTAPEGVEFAVLAGGSEDQPVQLSRILTLAPGATADGLAALSGEDYMPFNDTARVTISDLVTQQVLWSKDISAVGDWSYTPWQYWSFTSQESVTKNFMLTYETWNVGDSILPSYGLFDAAPGLPAFALVGVVPVIGALIRRRTR